MLVGYRRTVIYPEPLHISHVLLAAGPHIYDLSRARVRVRLLLRHCRRCLSQAFHLDIVAVSLRL